MTFMFFIINYVYTIDSIIFIKLSKVYSIICLLLIFLYCFGTLPPNLSPNQMQE